MLLSKKFNFLRPIKTSKLIRLGNNQDGGYLLPIAALKKSENLISFGLGVTFSTICIATTLEKSKKELLRHLVLLFEPNIFIHLLT